MENIKKYKTIKQFIIALQRKILEQIIDVVLKENAITKDQLTIKSKKPNLIDARRKIALLARWKYNIDGVIIAERLNLDSSQVFNIIYSSFSIMQSESDYRAEIEALMDKIKIGI